MPAVVNTLEVSGARNQHVEMRFIRIATTACSAGTDLDGTPEPARD
jgi:hypothetical protein